MLNENELENLYQLLRSKSNLESIKIALEIIQSNKVSLNLEIYKSLVEIAQEFEIEEPLPLNELREAELVQQIIHVNNAKAINIAHKEQLHLLEQHKHFNPIETIHCWSLNLKELPIQIQYYKELSHLNIGNNHLSKIPAWIGGLPLKHLNAFSNKLEKIPEHLINMPNLEEMQLGANFIKEIPEQIGQMKHLKYLGLTDNQIQRLPKALFELKGLEVLSLTGNPLDKKEVEQLKLALPTTSIYFA